MIHGLNHELSHGSDSTSVGTNIFDKMNNKLIILYQLIAGI